MLGKMHLTRNGRLVDFSRDAYRRVILDSEVRIKICVRIVWRYIRKECQTHSHSDWKSRSSGGVCPTKCQMQAPIRPIRP